MTALTIYREDLGGETKTLREFEAIAAELRAIGVELQRWRADRPLAADAGHDEVLSAYALAVDALNQRYGFRSVDVVSLRPDHPQRDALRQKFLAEHTHADFEVRFFVGGRGLFYLHVGERVYLVLCEQGDLISVPADTAHWFDMGAQPDFKCIRFFTAPEGWEGHFTGSEIARRFPDFDAYVAALA